MISRYVEHSVRRELGVTDEQRRELDERSEAQGSDSQATRLVRDAVRRGIKGHEEGLEAAVEAAFGKVINSLAGGFVPGDVNAEQAEATLAILEERGLIVGRGKVEEMAEARYGTAGLVEGRARPRVRPVIVDSDVHCAGARSVRFRPRRPGLGAGGRRAYAPRVRRRRRPVREVGFAGRP